MRKSSYLAEPSAIHESIIYLSNQYITCSFIGPQVLPVDPKPPKPTPIIDPTEAPAPEKCPKQVKQWAENGIPIETPEMNDDCTFVAKQCNAERCYCVNPKNGKRQYSPVEVPLGESYDCASKSDLHVFKVTFFQLYTSVC